MSPALAFNTAVSFTTNTNWQSYGGEGTMSYLSQMVGLTFHNFVSSATGIGISRQTTLSLGNFWVDLVRVTYYLLLPICLVFAVFLVSQGVIQNFKGFESLLRRGEFDARLLHGARRTGAAVHDRARRSRHRRRRCRALRHARLRGARRVLFIAGLMVGLMVGRTLEYLGKKINAFDVKMVMLSLLVLALTILGFPAWASVSEWGLAGLNNAGPHGFSEILYAYSSATGNNGSAFAGLTANPASGDPHYNVTLGIAMLIGRFLMIVPILAMAGSLAKKKTSPPAPAPSPSCSSAR